MPPINVSDLVATAVVAASRITGANPIAIVRGDLPPTGGEDFSIPRARAYAAAALRMMTDIPPVAICRMVGARHPDVYMHYVLKKVPKLTWWRPGALDIVTVEINDYLTKQSSDGGRDEASHAHPVEALAEPLRCSEHQDPADPDQQPREGTASLPSETFSSSPAPVLSSLNSGESDLQVTADSGAGEGRPALSDAARAEGAGRSQSSRVQERGFTMPRSKRRLEEELRQAVLNTGGRLVE